MLGKRLERLWPTTPRSVFFTAFAVSLLGGVAINLLLAPFVGRVGGFGGLRHDGYWELATNLTQGNGYVFEAGDPPVFHRPPLVPTLFAPLTLLPASLHRTALVVMHSLMIGLTSALMFDFTRRVFGGSAARCSLALLLGYPFLYWHVRNPMNVVIQTTCTTIVLYLLGRELLAACRRDKPAGNLAAPWRTVLLGLAAGAAILTHGTMLLSVPVLLAATGIIGLRLGSIRTLRISLTAGLIALLMVAPWTYRNWCVSGRFIPVVGGAGLQYFFGHVHWGFDGRDDSGQQWARVITASEVGTTEKLKFCGYTDPALDAMANRRMVEDVQSHPGRFVKRVALNAVEFYLPIIHDVLLPNWGTWRNRAEHALQSIWHLGLLALVGAGLWRNRRSTAASAGWIAVGAIVGLSACYCPFVTCITLCQYCLPTLPVLAFVGATAFSCRPAVNSEDVPVDREPVSGRFRRRRVGSAQGQVALTAK